METLEPKVSVLPAALDLTDCPYMRPLCDAPLFAGRLPVVANATLLNGLGSVGRVAHVAWVPDADPLSIHLKVAVEHSDTVWPYAGYLAVSLTVGTRQTR